MESIKSIQLSKLLNLDINPSATIEYVFWLKSKIKALEEEVKDYDEMMMSLLRSHGGKYEADLGEIKGTITMCATKSYEFSDEILKLEEKKKVLDTKIKAKKMVEIAGGAEVKSINNYLRYNINI